MIDHYGFRLGLASGQLAAHSLLFPYTDKISHQEGFLRGCVAFTIVFLIFTIIDIGGWGLKAICSLWSK
jgi:hypothetical protein